VTKRVRPVSVIPSTSRPKNRLLACLPDADFEQLRPHLRTIPIKGKHVFHRQGQPIREVYFLNGGVASMTMAMHDGTMVEVATIGDEGFVGIGAYLGAALGAETMMQVPDGSAEAMPAAMLKIQIAKSVAFADCLQRYSQGLLRLMMQSTACMALHTVQDRCCRWLLMAHDRTRQDQFQLSHEFLAMMLGSSRPTVTVVARTLQKAGIIDYTHGRMTVLDRPALEAASCECYASVKKEFDRLGL
jgi:CRP-like cAMP-binding protein